MLFGVHKTHCDALIEENDDESHEAAHSCQANATNTDIGEVDKPRASEGRAGDIIIRERKEVEVDEIDAIPPYKKPVNVCWVGVIMKFSHFLPMSFNSH